MAAKTIPLSEVKQLLKSGHPLSILDVRTPAEFSRVHAAGAKLLPFDELNADEIATARQGNADPLYVICHSGARSAKACERLQEAGVGGVYSIEGGTAAWEQMGLPVERGKTKVISLERQVRIVAGSLVLVSAILAWSVSRYFLVIPALIGGGLAFSGLTDTCGMARVLGRMPWNR